MTLAILAALVVVALAVVQWRHGVTGVRDGVRVSYRMGRGVIMLMVLGMLLAAMAQVVLPEEVISRWMGGESGVMGVLIGTAVGILLPGGPYVALPLAGSVMGSGAGVGSIAAFITAWSVIPLTRTIMWELPFLGARFTAARIIVFLPFPIVVGLLTPPVFDLFR